MFAEQRLPAQTQFSAQHSTSQQAPSAPALCSSVCCISVCAEFVACETAESSQGLIDADTCTCPKERENTKKIKKILNGFLYIKFNTNGRNVFTLSEKVNLAV
ncbi:MAG: hypothetical protein GJ680_05240 [Alteromonadaceae bacterium]|nr:hypothetical protein [Alteromonadaceae bacterium]